MSVGTEKLEHCQSQPSIWYKKRRGEYKILIFPVKQTHFVSLSRMQIEGYLNLPKNCILVKRSIQKYRTGMRKPFLVNYIIKVHLH